MLNNLELKRLIDELWNKFWSGGIVNPLTAIEQITYLIFMKQIDELDTKRKAGVEWMSFFSPLNFYFSLLVEYDMIISKDILQN